jgi:spermidine synthase
MFPEMYTKVPAGKLNTAEVTHTVVTKEDSDFTSIRAVMGRDEYVPPGTITRLLINGEIMMSDTPMEKNSNFHVVRRAKGHVFIAGLGLGMILWPILAKPEVLRVVVVEMNPDVINLVGPHTPKDPRLTIVQADAFAYKPTTKFDVIYFDIWPSTTTDNLPEMAKLHRRYGRFLQTGGWMESWQRGLLRARRRREQREEREYQSFARVFR